jgi:ATP-dependent Lon protease
MEAAMTGGRRVFLLAQREPEIERPELEDLYVIGTICSIRQILRTPTGGVRALVEGETRARLVELRSTDPYFVAEVDKIPEVAPTRAGDKLEALLRQTRSLI